MKYLFTAQFKNGEVYHQHPDDLPKEETEGSSFAYVKQKIDDVVFFSLSLNKDEHRSLDPEWATVHLGTGEFIIKGFAFKIDEKDFPNGFPTGTERRLVYFRRNTVTFAATTEIDR